MGVVDTPFKFYFSSSPPLGTFRIKTKMSLIDDDEDSFFLREFSSLERLLQKIQYQINERDSQSSVAGEIIGFTYESLFYFFVVYRI